MPSIAELAHQRDPHAIAEIMLQELQILDAQSFDVEITIVDSSLELQIRTNSTIDKEKLLTLIHSKLCDLHIESVAKFRVHYWRNDKQTHEQHPLWTEQLMLDPLKSSSVKVLDSDHLEYSELQLPEMQSSEEFSSAETQLSKHSVLQKAINKLSSNNPKIKIHLQATEKFEQSMLEGENISPHKFVPAQEEKSKAIMQSAKNVNNYWQLLLVGLSIVLLGLGIGSFVRAITSKSTDADISVAPKSLPSKQNRASTSNSVDSTNNSSNISSSPNSSRPEEKTITLEKFNLVQKGMTVEQVDKIFGLSGKVIAENMTNDNIGRVYSWRNPQGSNAIVEFKDGQVVAKAQAGL